MQAGDSILQDGINRYLKSSQMLMMAGPKCNRHYQENENNWMDKRD